MRTECAFPDPLTERTTSPAPLSAYGSPNAVVVCSAHLSSYILSTGTGSKCPPTDSYSLVYHSLCQLSCARPYPCSSNHYPSSPSQEMSSATMKSLTVLSVFCVCRCTPEYVKGQPWVSFQHIHLYNILHAGPSLA